MRLGSRGLSTDLFRATSTQGDSGRPLMRTGRSILAGGPNLVRSWLRPQKCPTGRLHSCSHTFTGCINSIIEIFKLSPKTCTFVMAHNHWTHIFNDLTHLYTRMWPTPVFLYKTCAFYSFTRLLNNFLLNRFLCFSNKFQWSDSFLARIRQWRIEVYRSQERYGRKKCGLRLISN